MALRLPMSVLAGMLGWLFVAPVAALIPKRRDWIAVIGRQDGRFLDNAKYFFLQATTAAPDLRLVFITEREDVCALFAGSHYEVARFPKIRTIWYLIRCGSAVVDEAAWFRKFRYFLLIRAKIIQLWHGVGCKWLEAQLWRHEAGPSAWASLPWIVALRLAVYWIIGRRTRYAAVITTSRFYRDEVFAPAFLAYEFPVIGYPRNDFGQSLTGSARALARRNVDGGVAAILDARQRTGKRFVLVAPTFRESGTSPMQMTSSVASAIDTFAKTHGIEFVFKFHPSDKNSDRMAGNHFHVVARDSDIYPLLPNLAALVTDYSSISMDFLLVDKPLFFLIPEDDDYATADRRLQFHPRTMMPGPVLHDWPSLLQALLAQWRHDTYAGERADLRSKAFDDLPQSEAVPKLIALMRDREWVRSAAKAPADETELHRN